MVFYVALAGFFAAMLAVFYRTLDDNKPKWLLENGLIGTNPGLGFRPMPPESNVESTLVWFEAANEKNTEYWIGASDKFLECELKILHQVTFKLYRDFTLFPAYTITNKDDEKNRVDCDTNSPPTNGKVCRVDVSSNKFGVCTHDKDFGYSKGSPCVFLKLNKVKI